ncbi:cytochrome P450 [Thamnocephalis sphaerospora]|uniref:Cytochrome P450 n=1 Tax=Thamnocephalis sphaerospora TaxID=78915 RepID=A0A4V1IX92_9FUNG|nr:cytochrome P450 [Thamnocephalis sphaerospora]|eukprot:RKP10249.1 cytochrome P450 [Thamnocephalis sphaerospora]
MCLRAHHRDFDFHKRQDSIGEVSSGRSFETLLMEKDGREPKVIHWINDTAALGVAKYALGDLCQPWLLPRMFDSERQLVEFARSAIQQRYSDKLGQNGRPKDVLQRLIDAVDPETGGCLTEDQLIAEIGGTETAGRTLTWSVNFLMENPQSAERLAEELRQALPDRDQPVTYAQVKNLPYLDAVLHETLRMRSPAVGTMRATLPGGVDLCGHFIPEGRTIFVSFYCIHHFPKVYGKDASQFRPERWIDSSAEQLAHMRRMFFAFSMAHVHVLVAMATARND